MRHEVVLERLHAVRRGGHEAQARVLVVRDEVHLGGDPARVEAFRERLVQRQLTVVVRRSRGQDIAAACGQLAAEGGPGDPRRKRLER